MGLDLCLTVEYIHTNAAIFADFLRLDAHHQRSGIAILFIIESEFISRIDHDDGKNGRITSMEAGQIFCARSADGSS